MLRPGSAVRIRRPGLVLGLGALALLNMAAAVLERILQRRMIAVEPIDVSKTGMMLLNNAVALLPATAPVAASHTIVVSSNDPVSRYSPAGARRGRGRVWWEGGGACGVE